MHMPAETTRTFPPFSLSRLLKTVFEPQGGERVAILIDLPDPSQVKDFAYLSNPDFSIQKYAHDVFYEGLRNGVADELNLKNGDVFAYKITGGSNLDLEDEAWSVDGRQLSLEKDIYTNYDLILCVSTFSATAPLTAQAKKFGFRGATLHGLNDVILSSGLAVDYNDVSEDAEKMRLGMTKADHFEIDYDVLGEKVTLRIECGNQEAQKSHGLCRGTEPDVANLPAGEVYFVPVGAEGKFPMKYDDGTIGICEVSDMRIQNVTLKKGDQAMIDEHNAKLKSDPVTGEIGELGLGTQELPVAGRDIQDEKCLGTIHVATGRSDHLGGHLVPSMFAEKQHATHDDILFAPHKTPEIIVTEARMTRDGKTETIIEHYRPSDYIRGLLAA